MQQIMQQAQRMQRDLQTKKEEIEKETFVGTYEWVEVVLNGKKEMVSCTIHQEEILKDDVELLQDFITLAVKDAISKIDKEYQSKMGQYAGMLDGLM